MKTPAQLTEGITPLPWEARPMNERLDKSLSIDSSLYLGIAWTDNDDMPEGMGAANRAYIVKACNSLPKLVEALQDMLKCNKELGAISRPVAEQARAVLEEVLGE